jgi:PAS domain S-box-containing protein
MGAADKVLALDLATIIPPDEPERIAALKTYAILDSPPEESFDRIVQIAAYALDVPMAFITFIDGARVWLKAAIGMDVTECEREGSFCSHTIMGGAPLVVDDATTDPRFKQSDLVVGPAGIRFYAGAPLRTEEGRNLGTLCVFDTKPRRFSERQVQILIDLAALVVDELALRLASDKALSASVERFKGIAANVPGIVCEVHIDRDGSWDLPYISPMVQDIFGFSPEDVVGDRDLWQRTVHGDDLASLRASFANAHASTTAWQWVGRAVVSSGEARWFRGSSIPRPAHDGGVLWTVLLLDITEQKEAQRHLEQAHKMEAIGKLTGGVAHDFNNLLAVISGNAELLQAKTGKDNPLVQAILRSTSRGAELTRQLLAFSRRQSLRPRVLDLTGLVAETFELVRRTLGAIIEVIIEGQAGLWPALADRSQVENALLNLVINARDAMPDGGRLTIACHNASLDNDAAARHPEALPGDYVMLAITDSGAGMTPEVLAQAFEPFYTTKEVGEGSGLGLSMVYGFAKQSGGHVMIDSEVGQGTTIKLYLPRAHRAAAETVTQSDRKEPRGKGETILLVEDNIDMRSVTAEIITGLGYRVIDVPEAEAAMAVAGRGEKIDLVLSDVVLPGGVSGLELARDLQNGQPGLPVIFMSGYPRAVVNRRGMLGAEAVLLHKPFQKRNLAEALRDALG